MVRYYKIAKNKTKDWALVHERKYFRRYSYFVFAGLDGRIV